MTKFKVRWTKEFTAGNLKGLFYEASIDFVSLDGAKNFVRFLKAHEKKSVKAIGGANYRCHNVTLESQENEKSL